MSNQKKTNAVIEINKGTFFTGIAFAAATFVFSMPVGIVVGAAYVEGRYKIIKKLMDRRKKQKRLKGKNT